MRPRRRRRDPRPVGNGICEIDLTRGFVALIDEADAALVSICNWYASFNGHQSYPYVKGKLPGKPSPSRLHRFLLGFPSDHVDHIDGNTLDNRRCNLRIASPTLSNANVSKRSDSRMQFKGIRANHGRFSAALTASGTRFHIGTFDTPTEAALAYDREAVRRFGQFARTNAALGLLAFAEAN